MERTKQKSAVDKKKMAEMVQFYSALVSRAQLAARLGLQYGNDREIYEALGYKTELDANDFSTRYLRQDIAKAIIDRPVKATWRGKFGIVETADDKETEFEKAWKTLSKKLKIKSVLRRLDTLVGLGKWGALLLGFDDVADPDVWKDPVVGKRKLEYIKPFGEGHAKIKTHVTDPKDPRFGLPKTYQITMEFPGTDKSRDYTVHYSRVIHVAGEQLEDDTEGLPRLQAVYNRLTDLEKLVGGSAEMFWRGARPGYQGILDEDFQLNEELEDDLQDQIDEYEHKLRRIFMLQGVKLEGLAPQVADPENHVHVLLQMIAAETGIPIRILIGSERGELASTQDVEAWKELIQARREEYAEPMIVNPFVDVCIETMVLPKPGKDGYTVEWEDLWSPSDKDKAEVGKTRSESLKNYVNTAGADAIIPPRSFFKHVMGLDDEDIELIEEELDAFLKEEERQQRELEATGEEGPVPPEGEGEG